LDALRPFKHRDSKDPSLLPNVTGTEGVKSVCVFDEKFVSQFVFKTDELLSNSFDIFIKSPEYDKQLEVIEDLIRDTKILFENNPKLETLINDFSFFIDAFGRSKTGIAANGVIGKGIAKGNKILNIPKELAGYKEYTQNSTSGLNMKWIKWHNDGNGFFNDVANQCQCPYCATGTDDSVKTQILRVSKEFDAKAVEHLTKMLDVFERLAKYFSDDTNRKIKEISTDIAGISDEQSQFLVAIRDQIELMKTKLWKIKAMGFQALKDTGKIAQEISSIKIDLKYFIHLDSTHSQKEIGAINDVLDSILKKATDLQAAVGKQNSMIKQTIGKYSKEINSFLEYAGYSYMVSLPDDGQGSYKLKLSHKDSSNELSNADNHLSFGERNAFALVLFMYQAIKENPDLIILDDPISSFDGNKKFAVLNKLFLENNSFKNKTVVLLTHEFGTVIDAIVNLDEKFKALAYHVENRHGDLIVQPVTKGEIKPFSTIIKDNILQATHKIIKLIYLRRLLKIEGDKGCAWNLLSNIFKDGRNTPKLIDESDMPPNDIADATEIIQELII